MSAPQPPAFFNSEDECRTLDRLRLKISPRYQPTWSLHVVEIRPGDGDRVYGFFGTPTAMGGSFALYPDDLCRTATDLAEAHHGAWPTYRKTPGPYAWLQTKDGFPEFMRTFDPAPLPNEPWTGYAWDCWYFRFEVRGRTVRRFVWVDVWETDVTWMSLRKHCLAFAQRSLRAAHSPNRRR